jgi:hypothetical protein
VPAGQLPAHLREPVGTNWVGPGRHVITDPVRGGDTTTRLMAWPEGDGLTFISCRSAPDPPKSVNFRLSLR